MRRARLLVGSDTGPLHLAAAVGTPCVGLFGPMPAERNGPYGPGHVAVQKMRADGYAPQPSRGRPRSMLAITVEDVVQSLRPDPGPPREGGVTREGLGIRVLGLARQPNARARPYPLWHRPLRHRCFAP